MERMQENANFMECKEIVVCLLAAGCHSSCVTYFKVYELIIVNMQ